MKIYLVGGAVRDELLGLVPRDHDYLVVDSSPEEMLKQGFQRVSSSYEVFLHPHTKDEYVLAPDLAGDLNRRDLTINAMAKDEHGNLIDFHHGLSDLKQKILRHTSESFADDLLRIYRVARFKSQYPDFTIAEETLELCRKLSQKKEFTELNGERILGEFKEALTAASPKSFFDTLKKANALTPHLALITDWSGLDEFTSIHRDPIVIFAWIVQKLKPGDVKELGKRLYISNEWLEAGMAASHYYHSLSNLAQRSQEEIVNFFYAIDAFRKPQTIAILQKLFLKDGPLLEKMFQMVADITIKDVSSTLAGKEIGDAIKAERIRRLKTSTAL